MSDLADECIVRGKNAKIAEGYLTALRPADAGEPLSAFLVRVAARLEQLEAALKLTEFGFNHARCNVCAGFDGKGESDGQHSKDCPIGIALSPPESGAS